MDRTNKKRSKMLNITTFFKQKWHLLVLFSIWLYSAIIQFIWLILDKTPPWGDGIPFILRGMWLSHQQSTWGWGKFVKSLFHYESLYPNPPVIELTYFLYYKIFGLSSEIEVMVNSLYLALGMIGIYGIGKHLFSKNIGLFSALIFASFPGILRYGNLGFKEFHIMCFLALTVYFLLKTNSFKNRKFSALFAISFAVMLLIKIESIIFIILPLTVTGIRTFFNRQFFKDRYRIINVILVLIIASSIFSLWYIVNFSNFINFLSDRVGTNAGMNSIYFSTKDPGYYFRCIHDEPLTKFQIFFFIFISIYILMRGLYSKTRTVEVRQIVFLLFCFAFPLLVFTFLSGKDASHILSLLVFVSLIMAGGCGIIRSKAIKFIFIFLIVFHAINTQFILLSPDGSDMMVTPCIIKLSPVDNLLYRLRGRFNRLYGHENRITKGPWGHRLKVILKFIKEDFDADMDNNSGEKPSVFLLANHEPFRFFQMEYYNKKMHSPVSLVLFNLDIESFKEHIFGDKHHYIVTEEPIYPTHPSNEEERQIKEVFRFIGENQKKFHQKYQIIKKIRLPTGSTAVIYRKT